MLRRRLAVVFVAALVLVAACGGGGGEDGVTISRDGFTATFPGEVQRRSDPIEVAGLDQPLSAESSTWESGSEALTIITTVLPPVLSDPQQVAGLLEGTARGMGASPTSGAGLLDADGTFRGHDAVAYEMVDGDLATSGIAFVAGDQLVQVIHISSVGHQSERLEELVESLALSN
jgi:hypothetical protein